MKKILIMLFLFAIPVSAKVSDFMVLPVPKRLDTKEDLIRLEAQILDQNAKQDAIARNIYFLELALVMPFETPIKALIRITDERQYEKYQYAIDAYINKRLAYEYIQYGNLFYKQNIYFFNNDFFEDYLDGYDIAEFYYKSSLIYRRKAAEIAKRAREIPLELNPNRDQSLIDLDQQVYTLATDPLDFEEIYQKLLTELQDNREKVLALQAKQEDQ